ncbi:hypothetical protein EJ05DRAFT_511136 [Pseudovirgaria hyperparasitica]|uniref:Tim44-like domain-containing protein n=1 Tax=Pseudovirgaria hyperparasitica TaxID=470096 RepID=A0A6A6W424_9PEZI|nr:uncharacterized protein EJ05DRAFT_511136 [Pseudovirgaria hyperparasitica]KAF2757305.1 hypothetical protein EJ05DRAFT_511136 [Pseudovirgaria hyperparasitica]
MRTVPSIVYSNYRAFLIMSHTIPRSLWLNRSALKTRPWLYIPNVSRGYSSRKSSGRANALDTRIFPESRYSPRTTEDIQSQQARVQQQYQEMAFDVPFFGDMYVKPSGSDLPSWWQQPKARFAITKLYLIQRIKGQFSILTCWWRYRDLTGWTFKSLIPFYDRIRGTRKAVDLGWSWTSLLPVYNKYQNPLIQKAVKLHMQYFESLASGTPESLKQLKKITTPINYYTLQQFVNRRQSKEKVSWEVTEVLEKPCLVADYAGLLAVPEADEQRLACRECVVRLRTKQQYKRFRRELDGTITTLSSRSFSAKENIVLQQKLYDNEVGEWKVLGFVAEKTPAGFEEDQVNLRKRDAVRQEIQNQVLRA